LGAIAGGVMIFLKNKLGVMITAVGGGLLFVGAIVWMAIVPSGASIGGNSRATASRVGPSVGC
ncbi:hypothetical protein ACFQ1S_31220, partial [Kibdelosporangium lantanae]